MNVYEFAIKMENDAEKLYAEQAELNQDDTLTTDINVFNGTESFKNELTERTDQLDVYKGALEKEKESVVLVSRPTEWVEDAEVGERETY